MVLDVANGDQTRETALTSTRRPPEPREDLQVLGITGGQSRPGVHALQHERLQRGGEQPQGNVRA